MYLSGVTDMFEKILLPTDFSPDSQRVLGYVDDIPGVREVVLYHVIDATRPSRKGWEHGQQVLADRVIGECRDQAWADRLLTALCNFSQFLL